MKPYITGYMLSILTTVDGVEINSMNGGGSLLGNMSETKKWD